MRALKFITSHMIYNLAYTDNRQQPPNRPKTQPEFQIMLHKKDFIIKTLEEPQDFWQLYDCKAGIVCRPRILAKTPKKYSIKPIKQDINIDPKLKEAFMFL